MTKFNAAFWKWFGDSRVVDSKRNPLVVYHGTGASFNKFKKTKCGIYSKQKYVCSAFFFADDPYEASMYAQAQSSHPLDHPNVMPVFLSLQDPFIVDAKGGSWWPASWGKQWLGQDESFERAIDGDHDGIVFKNIADFGGTGERRKKHVPYTVYVAFEPTQIKSAIGNDGSWDADDPDIRSNPRPEIDEMLPCLGGKCLIEARNLRDEFGGQLYDLVEPEPSSAMYYPGVVYHVVLKVGDKYIDGTGEWTKDELLDFWRRRAQHFERRAIPFRLEPHSRKRAKDQRMKGA